MPRCVALVADLMFSSKIAATGRDKDVECTTVRTADTLRNAVGDDRPADLVVIDLEILDAELQDLVQELRTASPAAAIIGFLPHVRADLAANARESGLDAVMARSAFSEKLPELFQRLHQHH